ncbi:hypothetical protein LEP3755_12870 [Leptolyngbya sp. NIES-3755]|nr:hypothetical protein LEP3755_12870 [Leptolyngbya sp. NIES-3755]
MIQSDEHLDFLLSRALQHPAASLDRAKAMHRLLLKLQSLPGILRSSHPDYPFALNSTWIWLHKNIETFDIRSSWMQNANLETALVNWINSYLRYRIRDLETVKKLDHISIDRISASPDQRHLASQLVSPTLEGLEATIAQEHQQNQLKAYVKMTELLKSDPQGVLKSCHPKANPNCTCYEICQRYLLKPQPDTYAQIAQDLNINYQTLVGHWKRNCLKKLQQMLSPLRYELEG